MALTIDDGDRLMARLAQARDSLPEPEVQPFFARLILLLADEIGDRTALLDAIDAALPRGADRDFAPPALDDSGAPAPASAASAEEG